jgi:hypothetical protein
MAAFTGDLARIALDPRSQTPCIGASGGIAGVITFYAVNFPPMRLAFLMRWEFVWFRWIRSPAWFVFVLWILFQLIGTLEQKAGMSSVSSAAHLGGAAVGVLAWLVWRKPTTKVEYSNDEIRMKIGCHFTSANYLSGPHWIFHLSCGCGANQRVRSRRSIWNKQLAERGASGVISEAKQPCQELQMRRQAVRAGNEC